MGCTRSEFSTILMTIGAIYPGFKLADQASFSVWYELLKEYDYNDLAEAVARHGKKNKFAPSIAELRAEVKNAQIDRQAKILTQKHFDSVKLGTAPTPQLEEKNRKPRRFETYEELMEATGGDYTMEELEQMLLAQAERIHREEAENDSV